MKTKFIESKIIAWVAMILVAVVVVFLWCFALLGMDLLMSSFVFGCVRSPRFALSQAHERASKPQTRCLRIGLHRACSCCVHY